MDSIVILFGSEADGSKALDDMEQRIPEKEMQVRLVEVDNGNPPSPEMTVIGLPVPVHGGAVPTFVGVADLDISKEERDYIFDRATTDMMIVEIKTQPKYMDLVKQIANMHSGQYYQEEDK